ncbi:DPP IV N-terminal domain-containing protein [Bacteroidota bacterium]
MKNFIFTIMILTSAIGYSQDPVQITTNSALDMRPVWTPDGNYLGFISNRNSTTGSGWQGSLYKVPAEGGSATLIETPQQAIHHFHWSSDGNSVVFYDGENEPLWDIFYGSSEGGEMTNLTNDQAANMAPKFSPDGTKIVFARNIDGNHDIWTMQTDGSGLTQISFDESSDNFPCFSPDGQKIAFASNRSGNFDIWIKDLVNEELNQITTDPGNEYTPCWSPDGNHLAYINDKSGYFDIYIISLADSNLVQFTSNSADDMYPSWSPDGTKIAYSSNVSGNDDIWVKEVDISRTGLIRNDDFDIEIYPNPTKGSINIRYSVKNYEKINISIADLNGRILENVINEYHKPGTYTLNRNFMDYNKSNQANMLILKISTDKLLASKIILLNNK